MDKTINQRQKKYREKIATGERKRLQVVIDNSEAEQLEKICLIEGISKTDFIRNAIMSWGK